MYVAIQPTAWLGIELVIAELKLECPGKMSDQNVQTHSYIWNFWLENYIDTTKKILHI